MTYSLYNRQVIDVEVDGVNSWDYPDFSDAYLFYALWADTLKPLSDDELDDLQEKYPDLAYNLAMESFH